MTSITSQHSDMCCEVIPSFVMFADQVQQQSTTMNNVDQFSKLITIIFGSDNRAMLTAFGCWYNTSTVIIVCWPFPIRGRQLTGAVR